MSANDNSEEPADGFQFVDIWHKGAPEWIRAQENELPDKFGSLEWGNTDIYSTVMRYSCALNTPGEPMTGPLYFDFDATDGNLEAVFQQAKRLIVYLEQEIGIDDEAGIRIWFSGNRGVHITVNETLLGVEPDPLLHKVYLAVARDLASKLDLPTIDDTIYSRRRMWRYPDSIHSKTGLRKIEMDVSEFGNPDAVREKAKRKRGSLYDNDALEFQVNRTAVEWIKEFARSTETKKYDNSFRSTGGGTMDQAGLPIVIERCNFIQYCRDHSKTLSEPMWYAMISNLCRFEGGDERIHRYSEAYPGYTEKETGDKITHAIEASGPISCEIIQDFGFEGCPVGGCGVKSPAGLAFQKVFVIDGFYTAQHKTKDEKIYSKPISNFTMKVLKTVSMPTHDGRDEAIRQVRLIDSNGHASIEAGLSPMAMSTINEFRKFCLGRGNYYWEGTQDELLAVLKMELAKSSELIVRPDRIGYMSDGKFWLFGNMAVVEGGGIIEPEDGVITVDGHEYMPIAFEGNNADGAVLPVVKDPREISDMQAYSQKVLEAIYNNLGLAGWLALGFCVAHVYLPEIVRQFRCFPELLLFGKLKAGKNTLARWIMSFFGLSASEKTISETTQNWITRALSYYSCMPVWLDEYRNERKIREKNGILRNAYDRIGAGKGHLGFGGIKYDVRGTVVLSGQAIPDDSALTSRCCIVRLSKVTRTDEYFDEVQRLSANLSAILVYLIRQKTPERIDSALKSIDGRRENLIDGGIDNRDALTYAIIHTGVELLSYDPELFEAFGKWIENEAQQDKIAKEEEDELNVFLEDITVLMSQGHITTEHWQASADRKRLSLWLIAIHNIWSERYRRRTGEAPFRRSGILEYLKEAPYYVEHNKNVWIKTGRGEGHNRKCLVLDMDKLPHGFRAAFVKTEAPES